MNNLKKLQSMNIDQLIDFLNTNGHHNAVWWEWFEEKYCNECAPEIGYINDVDGEHTWQIGCMCSYCETHANCRFFPDMDDVPDNKETIKLWLESEVNDD